MKVLGIIAEYNPFHLGHRYHLQTAKGIVNPDAVIAVLSGSFLQRGETAIVDKWARTKMALAEGVDLVFELPVVFACRSAPWFANGGVKTLEMTSVVTHLAFGAEEDNLAALSEMARILNNEPDKFKNILKKHLSLGLSYPKARNIAFNETSGLENTGLNQPNNILAIAYLRCLHQIESHIEPILIKRKGGYHSLETNRGFLSATGIRNYLIKNNDLWEKYVPETTTNIIKEQFNLGKGPVLLDNFTQGLFTILRSSEANELKNIIELEDGLENRILRLAQSTTSLNELINQLKTKRYPQTRIQRMLTHILLNFKQNNSFYHPQYLRVLGFNNQGKNLLKIIKKKSKLPLITKFAHGANQLSIHGQSMLNFEAKATDIYSLGYPQQQKRHGKQDYYCSPIFFE